LTGRVSAVVASPVDSPRGVRPERVAAAAGEALGVPSEVALSPSVALERARARLGEGEAVLVTGSLYLAGAIRSLVLGDGSVHRNER
jgi:folylpolyglutamate synthase/dihydropteroate synthase